jgi:glycosyltransferase involved in cell wall biosynthesis
MTPRTVVYTISKMDVGGTPRHLLEVFAHLDRRRWTPVLYCFSASVRSAESTLRVVRELDVEIIDGRVGPSLRGPRLLPPLLRLRAELRRRNVAIVHSYLFDGNLLGTLGARAARVPVALVSKRSLDTYERRWERMACRLVNRLADRVMANAEAVARNVVAAEGCPRHRIVVIPNGIDLARVARAVGHRAAPPLADGHVPVIGTIGRLSVKKGQVDLLEAAARVFEHERAARLRLVGDGPLRAALEERARELGIADRVEFTGRIEEGVRALADLDVFVLPSHMEGMSNGLLEAHAAGLPVIATDVGGNAEVTRDGVTGLVVPPRDPLALADAILRLLKDRARARAMAAAGQARIAEEFTVQRMVSRLERLYSGLLDGEEPGQP